ncbi:MAG: hypothetical protein IJT19_05895 [Bacteroidaceae bacterium]|nr:hypothetical protein [Bacteroidaceae bacterium]
MKNAYHNDIMDMLIRSGHDGMNVRRLARQLYNLHSGIFASDVVYERLYNQVRSYLWYQSRLRHSPFVRLRWGQYALKPDIAVQMDLFIDIPHDEDRPAKTIRRDESRQLLLFD